MFVCYLNNIKILDCDQFDQESSLSVRSTDVYDPTMGKENRKSTMLKREGSFRGEGGLIKKLKIPSLPPKLPRSDITFHFIAASNALNQFYTNSPTTLLELYFSQLHFT